MLSITTTATTIITCLCWLHFADKISSMAKWLPAAIHLHPLSIASSKERGFLFVCVRLSISGDSKWPGLVLCPDMSLSLWPRRSGTCGWVQSGSQVFSMVGLGHCNWQPHQGLREWKSSSREKRRLWIGNQKIIAIKEGLSWIEYSKLLANQSQKPVIESSDNGLKLDSIGP